MDSWFMESADKGLSGGIVNDAERGPSFNKKFPGTHADMSPRNTGTAPAIVNVVTKSGTKRPAHGNGVRIWRDEQNGRQRYFLIRWQCGETELR